MHTRATIAVILGLGGLLGAACSSGGDDGTLTAESGTQQPAVEAEHNDADVAFAQGMIPHHEQAVEMAQLAASNAEDDRVKDLAGRIEAAQSPEIEELRGWLESWGEPEDPAGMGHDTGAGMSEEDMAALESASGPDFDRMFLEMMVEHHRSAVEMAETEIADGQFPDAVELAGAIKAAQEAEIEEMQSLLAELGG